MIYILPTDTCYGLGCPLWDIESYQKIYTLKQRPPEKPLSVLVESFDWLGSYTPLSKKQLQFLKTYPRPFTVLTDCSFLTMLIGLDQEDLCYFNKEVYKKFGFRVAHTQEQKNLIDDIGPLFLTSANLSGQTELYRIQDVKKTFENESNLTYIGNYDLPQTPPSDIFEFEGDTLNVIFKRTI